MERLRFQTRIYIGYAILFIVSLLLFAFSFLEFNRIEDKIQEIYTHPLVVKNSIKEIELNTNASIFSVYNFLDTESQEVSQKAIAEINKYDSLSLVNYRIIKMGFSGPKLDYANALVAYKDFTNTRNKIIALKNSGNLTKAKSLIINDCKQKVNVLFEKLELISNFSSNNAAKIHDKTISDIKSTRLIFVLFTGFLMILSISVLYFISKSITRPINHLLYQLNAYT